MAWRQCPKRLWLEVNRPELVVYPPSTQRRFAMGHQVGDVARDLQPGGVLIEPPTLGEALRETARLLARRGDLTLFEATFSHGGVLVRADLLLREGGVARMVEVKSATEVRPYHIDDSAVQTWVVRGAGVPLERVALACIDRGFVYAGDDDYHGLLRETDVTAQVDELVAQVPDWIAGCQATLADEMPGHGIWAGCTSPFACPFIPLLLEGSARVPGLAAAARPGWSPTSSWPPATTTCGWCPSTWAFGALHRRVWQATRSGRPDYVAPGRGPPGGPALPALLPRLRDDPVRRAGLGRHAALGAASLPVVLPRRAGPRRARAPRVPRHERRAAHALLRRHADRRAGR